ncbi:MAG: hypothetical protein GF308_12315 [Candidatus Heimdallarchaeota archaeon]|nr:hypothetical protein [Candidatus Heimdallarchaeota archaeon]
MALPWLELLLFPGFVFILGVTFLFEHITARVYALFEFRIDSPLFIPVTHHFKFWLKRKPRTSMKKDFLQAFLLVVLMSLPLTASLVLPINLIGSLPKTAHGFDGLAPATEGVVGILSFEGDLFFLLSISLLFSIIALLTQWLNSSKSSTDSLKSIILFLIFDIPLFLALGCLALVEHSTSLSMIAEDIRLRIYFNPLGGIFWIPLGLIVAVMSLSFKFDQPYFDRLDTLSSFGRTSPTQKDWRFSIWNISLRMMEMVLTGAIVSVFLGGANLPIPLLEGYETLTYTLNFISKSAVVLIVVAIIRSLLPRMRLDQKMNFCWKFLTPGALVSMLVSGVSIAILKN